MSLCLCGLYVVLLSGCGQARLNDPGVVVIAVPTSPNNFDPRIGTDEVSQKVYQLVYDNLLDLDDQLRVGPGLATHWEQPDELTYVLHLRHGVRFHDGHELSAADVVHTFGTLIDPNFVSARRGAYAALARVEAVDRYTAKFTLRELSGSFLIQLVLPVIPAGAGAELRGRPVGTGPYAFRSFQVDDRLDLVAFSDYYGGAPKNAGVVLKIVPDEIMRGLELKKGTVDVVVNDISPDTVEAFRDVGAMQVAASPGTDYAYLGLNLRDPALSDKRVRQAIGYAINILSLIHI